MLDCYIWNDATFCHLYKIANFLSPAVWYRKQNPNLASVSLVREKKKREEEEAIAMLAPTLRSARRFSSSSSGKSLRHCYFPLASSLAAAINIRANAFPYSSHSASHSSLKSSTFDHCCNNGESHLNEENPCNGNDPVPCSSHEPLLRTRTTSRRRGLRALQPHLNRIKPKRITTDTFSAIELALDSVVKVFTVSCSPNYLLPWQNKSQRETMGSGLWFNVLNLLLVRIELCFMALMPFEI